MDMPRTVCKYVAKATDVSRIPYHIEQAVRYSLMGRPGATYVEIAGDLLRTRAEGSVYYPPLCPNPPVQPAADTNIKRALACLAAAKSPLLIVGKGAAYANASQELTDLV